MILILSNFCIYILSAYGLKDAIELLRDKFPKIKSDIILTLFLIFSLLDIYRIDNRIINTKEDYGQQNHITTIDNFESVVYED